jgi:hypothetical protein
MKKKDNRGAFIEPFFFIFFEVLWFIEPEPDGPDL